jgi:hypothetical protein
MNEMGNKKLPAQEVTSRFSQAKKAKKAEWDRNPIGILGFFV